MKSNRDIPGTRYLGTSTMAVPPIAIGAEALGGYDWANLDVAVVERAIIEALDSGFFFFDVADCYGRGEGERRLGALLRGRRSEAVIATKFGVRFDGEGRTYRDNSPTYIREALEGSLRRLRTDCIDLYQLHWPDGKTPLQEVFGTLEQMRNAGKIRHYGVTNIDLAPEVVSRACAGLVSFSREFSLANRAFEPRIKEQTKRFGLTFMSWGSLGQGILTGKYHAQTTFPQGDRRARPKWQNFHGAKLAQNLRIVEELRALSARLNDASPAALAIRWIQSRVAGAIPLVGVKSPAHVAHLARAIAIEIPEEAFERLDDVSSEHAQG